MVQVDANQLQDVFIKKNLVTQDQMNQAINRKEEKGGEVFYHLVELEFIEETQVLEILANELDIPPVRLWKYQINRETLELVGKEFANEYQVIPVAKAGDLVTVAMLNPWNENVLEELQSVLSGSKVYPILVTQSDMIDGIDTYYRDDYESELLDVLKDMDDGSVELESGEGDESDMVTDASVLLSLTNQAPVVRLTNSILAEGVARRASDIFIEPGAEQVVVRYRVDGVLQEALRPPKAMHQGVISRLKIMANLDIAEQRLPQDGRVKLKIENRWVEFRLSTIPSYFGEKACLRILDPGQVKLNLDILGFDKSTLDVVKKAASQPYGMLLVCGPTGSGKTTTLYSMLNFVDGPEKNLVTVEDPVEFNMNGINQVNVKQEVGLTFSAALRSILRQDPDVVLLGEIRDTETMDIAVKAALTGHLVLSTLHTNSASGTITRLTNMGVEPFLINSSIIMIGAQRLLRRLCEGCKEEIEADEEQLKGLRAGKDEKIKIYKAVGCKKCHMKGYAGRISILECLVLTPKLRKMILEEATENDIKKMAREEGMVTLRERALQKVREGITSLDEAYRVTIRDEEDS